jgi:hypothetical protein
LHSSTAGGGDSGDGENLPVTHNLPWSDEEQQRLEELLQIYPDEPVQAQRFNKISAALGTRTPRQVGSRVQKYFIKLAKNGLPVPGRITIPVRQYLNVYYEYALLDTDMYAHHFSALQLTKVSAT